jgi:hypothetical protein
MLRAVVSHPLYHHRYAVMAIVSCGQWLYRQPGNQATRQPGNQATRQPGNQATMDIHQCTRSAFTLLQWQGVICAGVLMSSSSVSMMVKAKAEGDIRTKLL